MTRGEDNKFAEELETGSQFAWWSTQVQQVEASDFYKVVLRNRVTGNTITLYNNDENEAARLVVQARVEPNDPVRACAWLAQEIHKLTGDNAGTIEYLDARVAALEKKVGIEPDDDSPF